MKTRALFVLLLLTSVNSFTQANLVINPSFENGDNKGFGSKEIKGRNKALFDWYSPIKHSPDLYMTPKKPVAVANSGRNAIGLVLGSGKQSKTKFEYITGKLSAPLIAGQTYCICFNTILQRTSKWAATDVGVLLHHDEKLLADVADPSSLSATLYANEGEPMTNTKWNTYCGYYVASGGEEYISFGKFGTSESVLLKDLEMEPYSQLDGYQSKAYYQLDDLSVTALTETTDCGCAEDIPVIDEELIHEHKDPPYLFALDASGSMKKHGLFDSLRQNLVRFVNGIPTGTAVSFVTFSSSARKIFTGEKQANTISTMDSLLSRASIGGGTNVIVGLQLAYASWEEEGADSAKMILISDGQFNVTPNIVSLVKEQYDTNGRKLTLIQIGARATGIELLAPYMDDYIYTTQSELSQAISQLKKGKVGKAGNAVNCECVEEFSDTLNYHFVIDYSGSMKSEKTRATMALSYLFEQAPDNAMISVTAFNTTSRKLYVGKKSDITMAKLTFLLNKEFTGGGTDPTPGVKDGLQLAESMSENRYSHLILITDLKASILARHLELGDAIKTSAERFELAAHAITVSDEGMVATYAQFDMFSKRYAGVSRSKFEKDLFETIRSSCDYTSQANHYSPATAALKAGSKRAGVRILKALLNSAANAN